MTRSARLSLATSAAAPATRRSSTRFGPQRSHEEQRSDEERAAMKTSAAVRTRPGMTTTPTTISTEAPTRLELGHIGEPGRRPDGPPKVQGQFEYSSDLSAAGM